MSCEQYQPFMDFMPLHIVLVMQVFCGFLSAVFSIYTLAQCRNLYFHVNCRTLIHGQLVIFVIHSVFIVIIQLMHLWKYTFSDSACDVVTSAITCTILRFPLTTSYFSFVILQFMMVLERMIATFRKRKYERAGQHIGIFLVLFGVAMSMALTVWSIQEENFSNSYPYCSSGSAITIGRLSIIHYMLCTLCAASLVALLGLRIYNKYALDRKTFSLADSFHLRENQHILQLLCPLAIFEAIFLFFFVAGGAIVASFRHDLELIIFRTIFAAFYFIPYYTAITPLIILLIVQKAKRNSLRRVDMMRNITNEKEIYFSSYYKLWNKL